MSRQIVVTTLVVLVIAGLTAGAQRNAGTPAATTAGVGTRMQAVGTVKEIMLAITIPTSNDVFNAASEPPKDDAGWSRARHQALALAESSNLLLMPERARNRNVTMIPAHGARVVVSARRPRG